MKRRIIGRILKKIASIHRSTRIGCKWMSELFLRLRYCDIQIKDISLGHHKKSQVHQFESSFDTMIHQYQDDWLKETQSHKKG